MSDPFLDAVEFLKLGIAGAGLLGIFLKLVSIGRSLGQFEQNSLQQAAEIENLTSEMREVRKTVTEVAVQKQRMDAQDTSIALLMKWYDELRRGVGLVGGPS